MFHAKVTLENLYFLASKFKVRSCKYMSVCDAQQKKKSRHCRAIFLFPLEFPCFWSLYNKSLLFVDSNHHLLLFWVNEHVNEHNVDVLFGFTTKVCYRSLLEQAVLYFSVQLNGMFLWEKLFPPGSTWNDLLLNKDLKKVRLKIEVHSQWLQNFF